MVITIDQSKVGLRKINLPAFSGVLIDINRRGIGTLTDDEVRNLPEGGFELLKEDDFFVLGDVFEITKKPVSVIQEIAVLSVIQYPHVAVINVIGGSFQDIYGDYHNYDNYGAIELACRYEPSSGYGFVTAADGTKVNYTAKIYFPLPSPKISNGSNINVYDKDLNVVGSGTIKRYFIDQLDAKAWV